MSCRGLLVGPRFSPASAFLTAARFLTPQVVELDFQYPSEGIHKRWEAGYRITCAAATQDQAAFVLSSMRSSNVDETQASAHTGLGGGAHGPGTRSADPQWMTMPGSGNEAQAGVAVLLL